MSNDDVATICETGECHCVESSDTECVVDLGAPYHYVSNRKYFVNYQLVILIVWRWETRAQLALLGYVILIRVKRSVRCMLARKNVRHIPDLILNLLFANVLDRERFQHILVDGQWKLSKNSSTIARGNLCCTLYKTCLSVCSGELNAVEEKNSHNMWHRTLGHIHDKWIKLLIGKSLIPVDRTITIDPCDYCLVGK